MQPTALPLSVIVPVRNASSTLTAVLTSIRDSELSRSEYELIVVDDSSSDSSASIAARYADVVVRLSHRSSGPAYARNRGVELARGEMIAFIDPDVSVAPHTISRMLSTLTSSPGLAGISAAHDDGDRAGDFVTQYWNLLLRFGEERYAHTRAHFTSDCSIVRREALVASGMYDEWRFTSGSVESLELGQRLSERGYDVLLDPSIKVRRLTQWTLGAVCSEVWTRSVALARSLGYQRTRARVPSDVVFTLSRALTPIAAAAAIMILAASSLPNLDASYEATIAILALLLSNYSLHTFLARSRGIAFAIVAAPVHLAVQMVSVAALCAGWILRDAIGDIAPDPVTQAYAEVGVQTWPPIPRRL